MCLWVWKDVILMDLEMGVEVELSEETSEAVLAGEPLLSLMDLKVLV